MKQLSFVLALLANIIYVASPHYCNYAAGDDDQLFNVLRWNYNALMVMFISLVAIIPKKYNYTYVLLINFCLYALYDIWERCYRINEFRQDDWLAILAIPFFSSVIFLIFYIIKPYYADKNRTTD